MVLHQHPDGNPCPDNARFAATYPGRPLNSSYYHITSIGFTIPFFKKHTNRQADGRKISSDRYAPSTELPGRNSTNNPSAASCFDASLTSGLKKTCSP